MRVWWCVDLGLFSFNQDYDSRLLGYLTIVMVDFLDALPCKSRNYHCLYCSLGDLLPLVVHNPNCTHVFE